MLHQPGQKYVLLLWIVRVRSDTVRDFLSNCTVIAVRVVQSYLYALYSQSFTLCTVIAVRLVQLTSMLWSVGNPTMCSSFRYIKFNISALAKCSGWFLYNRRSIIRYYLHRSFHTFVPLCSRAKALHCSVQVILSTGTVREVHTVHWSTSWSKILNTIMRNSFLYKKCKLNVLQNILLQSFMTWSVKNSKAWNKDVGSVLSPRLTVLVLNYILRASLSIGIVFAVLVWQLINLSWTKVDKIMLRSFRCKNIMMNFSPDILASNVYGRKSTIW